MIMRFMAGVGIGTGGIGKYGKGAFGETLVILNHTDSYGKCLMRIRYTTC